MDANLIHETVEEHFDYIIIHEGWICKIHLVTFVVLQVLLGWKHGSVAQKWHLKVCNITIAIFIAILTTIKPYILYLSSMLLMININKPTYEYP
jgi:hypothetical protein